MKRETTRNKRRLYNIKVAECAKTWENQQFNGPYVGAMIFPPDDLKDYQGLKLYFKMSFDSAETYKQVYKITVTDYFYEADRTVENVLIGPWEADGNSLELTKDLSEYIIDSNNQWVVIYANDENNIEESLFNKAERDDGWTLDTDTIMESFNLEVWYETDEH